MKKLAITVGTVVVIGAAVVTINAMAPNIIQDVWDTIWGAIKGWF